MREFELFEVTPNAQALRVFREEYIKEFKGDILYKIISRSTNWYKYNKGIYSPSKISMGVTPILDKKSIAKYQNEISKFTLNGASGVNQGKAIKRYYEDDVKLEKPINDYFYLLSEPVKMGRTYNTTAIKINEDIYNMIMIQYRNFIATTTPEDLRRYSEYFNVSDDAYSRLVFSDDYLEDLFRCGVMSNEEIESMISKLETEEQAILSLRNK